MKISKIFLSIVALLSGCATLYQKEGIFTNGYSDLRAGRDTFVITYRANEFTPREKVKEYALKRANALARKNGYRYFTVLDQVGEGKHLNYPSLRLTIQCFHERPAQIDVIKVT